MRRTIADGAPYPRGLPTATDLPRASQGLVVSYSSLLGGAERLLLDLAPALSGRATLACPRGPLAEAAADSGLEVRELRPRRLELRGRARDRLGAPLRIAAQARELRAIFRDFRPGWLVAWNMRGVLSVGLALGRRGPPLLFQHNDFLPTGGAAWAVRAAANRAQLVSALSGPVAHDLDPGGRLGERLVISHPGIDLRHFAAQPPGPDGREVLVLGAIEPWKRPDLALETAARVKGMRLLLAGDPIGERGVALLSRLRGRAARADLDGRVDFLGRLADPRPTLHRASLLLHCADREPFGLVLAEALASGRPVVAPAAGGPLEIVDDSCGRLYPPGDAEAAAAAVRELLADRALLARLSEGARRRAEREFDLAAARRRFAALVDRIATMAGRA